MGKKRNITQGFLLAETMVCLVVFSVTVLLVGFALVHLYTTLNACHVQTHAFDEVLARSAQYLVTGNIPQIDYHEQFTLSSQVIAGTQKPQIITSSIEVALEPIEYLKISAVSKNLNEKNALNMYSIAVKQVHAS